MRHAATFAGNRPWISLAVFGAAWLTAAAAARPYAGGWNDGSRLATVESLVDHHTLAIDQSIFVRPSTSAPDKPSPYSSSDLLSTRYGTGDKLFIGGEYYSDKSPVPALALGLEYFALQKATGMRASEQVDSFCRMITILSSGFAYALSVTAMFALFQELGLHLALALAGAASFGLSTMALTYAEHVNNHSLFLGVASLLMLALCRWSRQLEIGEAGFIRLCWIGCLVGAGYAIDLGVGPALIVATGSLVLYRTCAIRPLIAFTCGMAPWLILHHAVNYLVGGTIGPANANSTYFQWPGCSFNAQNMTGGWHHASMGDFFLYALSLLFGKRGFVGHNLPLFLAFPAAWSLLRERRREANLVVFAIAWSLLTWLMYAVNSTNSSGQCCSIRWFLPLLAPGFFVVGVGLRDRTTLRPAFFIFSGWGLVLAVQMLEPGPWMQHMVPYFWQIQGTALASLLIFEVVRGFSERQTGQVSTQHLPFRGKTA
jgi:hypothetical protein